MKASGTPYDPAVTDQSKPPEADFSRLRTIPVATRPNLVRAEEFAKPPVAGGSFAGFLDALPAILKAADFMAVVDAIADAARAKRAVVAMIGGRKLSPLFPGALVAVVTCGAAGSVASDMSRPSYQENADGYVLTAGLMRWFWDHYADPADR